MTYKTYKIKKSFQPCRSLASDCDGKTQRAFFSPQSRGGDCGVARIKKLSAFLAIAAILLTGAYFVMGGYGQSGPDAAPNLDEYGLVGYWNMEEGKGQTVYDRSGNGNNGTLGALTSVGKDDPVFTSGYSSAGAGGTALKFDGKDDYVDAGSGDTLNVTNKDFSVEMWVYVKTSSTVYPTIATKRDSSTSAWELIFNNNRFIFYRLKGATQYIAHRTGLSLNTWYHVVATFDDFTNTPTVYVNGVAGTPTTGGASFSGTILKFGGKVAGTYPFNGSIDEVRIYNRALSADEIRQHYNQKKPVLDMKFDEGSGQKAYDESFNNNDGWLGGTSNVEASDPTWTTGKFGSALSFDGGDYININNSNSLDFGTNDFTFEAWIKTVQDCTGNKVYLSEYGTGSSSIWLGCVPSDGAGKAFFSTRDSNSISINSGSSITTINDNNWYYLSGVKNGNNVYIYINGKLENSGTGSFTGNFNFTNPAYIGRHAGSYYANGLIDEPRIYNYARTQDEILTDYNDGKAAHLGKNNQRDDGLVGYWNMEEGTGQTVFDRSGNSNNGTLGASTSVAKDDPVFTSGYSSSGPGGTALKFDGVDDYVNAGNGASLNISDNLSMFAWIKTSEVSEQIIVNKWGNTPSYILLVSTTTGTIQGYVRIGGVSKGYVTSLGYADSSWHNVGLVYNGSFVIIYIDGVSNGSPVAATGNIDTSPTENVLIGRYTSPALANFKGLIDEVRIYNRALSADEIRQHYNQKKPVLEMKFDEGSGTTAYDESFNNNDGTIYGTMGTAEAGAANTLTDNNKAWATNEWAGETIEITGGTGSGQTRTVASNTATVITVSSNWSTNPGSDSKYHITSKDEWTSGKYGSAISFDGVDDFIKVSDNNVLNFGSASTANFTLEAWVNTNDVSAQQAIALQLKDEVPYPTFRTWITGNKLRFNVRDDNTSVTEEVDHYSNSTINNNTWYHVTFIYNSGTDKSYIYINGVEDSNKTIDGQQGSLNQTEELYIGRYQSDNYGDQDYFNGLIDSVRVYSYARTQDEILTDYNDGKAAHLGKDSQRDDGLVGFWNMEEGKGQTVYDRSGNGNNGTLGALTSVGKDDPVFTSGYSSSGPGGTALKFDGVNDYVDAGNAASVTNLNEFTLMMWVKINDGDLYPHIMSKAGAFWLRSNGSQVVFGANRWSDTNGEWFRNDIVSKGQWYHLAVTYNYSNIINDPLFYLDGQIISFNEWNTPSGTVENETGQLFIGHKSANYEHWSGIIDEVRIYNRALSADEIRMHYNQKKPILELKMDEGSGTTTKDESFNNNDGTLYSGATVCSNPPTAGCPTWTTGKYGSAISFDGVNDYVKIPRSTYLEPANSLTLETWVKLSVAPPVLGQPIVKARTAGVDLTWALGVRSTEKPEFNLMTGGSETTLIADTDIVDGNWHHIIGIYDGSQMKIYVDGVLKNSGSKSGSITYTTTDVYLGSHNGQTNYFPGLIDSVRVYNYARTPSEILVDYNNGVAGHLR